MPIALRGSGIQAFHRDGYVIGKRPGIKRNWLEKEVKNKLKL